MKAIRFASLMLLPQRVYAFDIPSSPLSPIWGIPFLFILISIAIGPSLTPRFWHAHYGKIILSWVALFLIPFSIRFGYLASLSLLCHTLLTEFIPFILLVLSLFIVSGGIFIEGHLFGRPKVNVILLLLGTILASIMGTTGAAMLLIRPLIRANKMRRYKTHTIIFFIFLVANIGGGLTPLGDPPLFLGFLNGVHFLWITKQMLMPVFICTTILITLFYIIDSYYFNKEKSELKNSSLTKKNSIRLYGKINLLLLAAIVATVLLSGVWQSIASITFLGTTLVFSDVIRDSLLLLISLISLKITPKQVRNCNQFNWAPLIEIAKLFVGIFITIYPVLTILKMGREGSLAPIVSLVSNDQNEPINIMYFWITGLLSAFLDNAPTYLVFFNLAGSDANLLMGSLSHTLLAISMASVFMGALTYIGNAPNFMIKTIATQQQIKMPSFFGYIKWSVTILLPTFFILSLLFF